MLISSQTKIAALLKHHPDVLEAIVTLSPDFKKLRNPILRKLMAGRTSIAMAAKIGGCKPEDFFDKLKPYGFEVDGNTDFEREDNEERKALPAFILKLKPSDLVNLDVREMLSEGTDPLRLIQEKVKQLKEGQAIKIVNTFEPSPLVKLLEKQGFKAYVDFVQKDLVETYFIKNTGYVAQFETAIDFADDWDKILKRYEENLEKIDVRQLEMPMPMMTILEALDKLPKEKALYVHHKRIPVFLLTELRERNFDFRVKEIAEGEVYLLIFKN